MSESPNILEIEVQCMLSTSSVENPGKFKNKLIEKIEIIELNLGVHSYVNIL